MLTATLHNSVQQHNTTRYSTTQHTQSNTYLLLYMQLLTWQMKLRNYLKKGGKGWKDKPKGTTTQTSENVCEDIKVITS